MVNQKQEDVDPRDCMYRLGNAIRKRITKALANDNVDQESKRQIEIALEKEEENKQLINYETLTIIHKHLQRIDITYNDYFFEFMDQCKIVAPPSRKVCLLSTLNLFICFISFRTKNLIRDSRN